MPGQRRLDFRRLDAMTADLHLIVQPAAELEHALRCNPREVAGAIDTPAGAAAERIRHEALGCQIRPSDVAVRDAVPADP